MTQATRSADAFTKPTKTFDRVVSTPDTASETSSQDRSKVYEFSQFPESRPPAPSNYITIGNLVGRWEEDKERRTTLEKARRWTADVIHPDEGDTVRTLRLRKGWSQARLAEQISTSQSHIARIERGTENLLIGTCRKLCGALEIDMNVLDQALQRQESIARTKAND